MIFGVITEIRLAENLCKKFSKSTKKILKTSERQGNGEESKKLLQILAILNREVKAHMTVNLLRQIPDVLAFYFRD